MNSDPNTYNFRDYLSSVDEIVNEIRNGRMVILVDDEDRENEGDLVIAGQMATPDAINFMATHGRGLVCLAMESKRVQELQLPQMIEENEEEFSTAFTLSIEAKEGVTTGISAADRARTIAVAIDSTKTRNDIVIPGHVFPLQARDGGVLVRAGHTEAAVDISRMAGLIPAGVICEIMKDDGEMARMPDLIAFAQLHNLKIGTIEDLIAHRRQTEDLVEQRTNGKIDSHFGGEFDVSVWRSTVDGREHIALVKGDLSDADDNPVLVRVHVTNPLEDVLGSKTGHESALHNAMRIVSEEGRGIVLCLSDPHATDLATLLGNGVERAHARSQNRADMLREYGVGAQILRNLGVSNMILLSNTKQTLVGLDAFGLHVTETRPIPRGEK